MVLDDDTAYLSERSWGLNSVGYLRRTFRIRKADRKAGKSDTKTVLMHRLIMGAKPGEVVDHINGNKYDNRRSNLRIVTQGENLANRHLHKSNKTSSYLGVSFCSDYSHKAKPWQMQVRRRGVRYTKSFETEIEAARAYGEIIKKHGYTLETQKAGV